MFSVEVVIETPKGSAQKYDFDAKHHFFKLKKILPSGMVFPYDFGFIPGTKGQDGDPLDAIMISEFSSFPGCVVECRFIGGFKAKQSEKSGKQRMIRNDRFIAIPCCSQIFSKVETMDDLPSEIMQEMEDFFMDYNKIEGKKFEVIGRLEPKDVKHIIEENVHNNS